MAQDFYFSALSKFKSLPTKQCMTLFGGTLINIHAYTYSHTHTSQGFFESPRSGNVGVPRRTSALTLREDVLWWVGANSVLWPMKHNSRVGFGYKDLLTMKTPNAECRLSLRRQHKYIHRHVWVDDGWCTGRHCYDMNFDARTMVRKLLWCIANTLILCL